jgi:hypothetical protein
MREILLKIARDLTHNRQIEWRLTAFLALAFKLLPFFSDIVSTDLRWTACSMGIGLLLTTSNATPAAATPAAGRAYTGRVADRSASLGAPLDTVPSRSEGTCPGHGAGRGPAHHRVRR